jgi:hypothetical protein
MGVCLAALLGSGGEALAKEPLFPRPPGCEHPKTKEALKKCAAKTPTTRAAKLEGVIATPKNKVKVIWCSETGGCRIELTGMRAVTPDGVELEPPSAAWVVVRGGTKITDERGLLPEGKNRAKVLGLAPGDRLSLTGTFFVMKGAPEYHAATLVRLK